MIKIPNFTAIKKRQQYVLWGMGALVMGGIIVYGWVAVKEMPLSQEQAFKSSIATGTGPTNPQETWVYQFRQEAELTKKRLDMMQETLQRILKINEMAKDEANSNFKGASSPKTFVPERPSHLNPSTQNLSPTTTVQTLQEELKTHKEASTALHGDKALPPPPGILPPGMLPLTGTEKPDDGTGIPSPSFRSPAVRKVSLSLRNARGNSPLKTVDNTVPAGAFARAILLGGVDASASIQASSDPRPALLRIMDTGTLPRRFRSDLLGCHVLAASYGDISSERVFMRLEKLTCTERKTGEIVEVKAQGYVAGEDGRTGIRGTVVDRAGESLRNVLMGGFLGGMGEFLSQSRNASLLFSPMGGLGGMSQASPPGMADMLKQGAGKGIHNALDKYADFYIKRAEQLQPVIQVAAGRQVDIVFTEGVPLDGTLYRQALGKANDQGRMAVVQQFKDPGNSQ